MRNDIEYQQTKNFEPITEDSIKKYVEKTVPKDMRDFTEELIEDLCIDFDVDHLEELDEQITLIQKQEIERKAAFDVLYNYYYHMTGNPKVRRGVLQNPTWVVEFTKPSFSPKQKLAVVMFDDGTQIAIKTVEEAEAFLEKYEKDVGAFSELDEQKTKGLFMNHSLKHA